MLALATHQIQHFYFCFGNTPKQKHPNHSQQTFTTADCVWFRLEGGRQTPVTGNKYQPQTTYLKQAFISTRHHKPGFLHQ
jgi:hypothetical protein